MCLFTPPVVGGVDDYETFLIATFITASNIIFSICCALRSCTACVQCFHTSPLTFMLQCLLTAYYLGISLKEKNGLMYLFPGT